MCARAVAAGLTAPVKPTAPMPSFAKLPTRELRAIVVFLHNLR